LLQVVSFAVQDNGIGAFVGEGEVNPAELLGAYSDFLTGGPTPLTLWDLSSATIAGIDSESLRDLARCIAQMGEGRHGGKTAIAVGRAVDFGLARMLEAFLSFERFPVKVAVFPDSHSARAWLTHEVIDV
jgi:hypothetical protein